MLPSTCRLHLHPLRGRNAGTNLSKRYRAIAEPQVATGTLLFSHVPRLAAIPIIAPVIGGGVIAATAAWLWRATLVSRILSRRLGARIEVQSFSVSPMTKTYGLSGVKAHDRFGRPLFAFDSVQITYRMNEQLMRRQPHVEIKRPELIAIFSNAVCTRSNWSDWAQQFKYGRAVLSFASRSAVASESKTNVGKQSKTLLESKKYKDKYRKGSRFSVDIKDGLTLSLRSEVLGGNRIVQDVRFSNLGNLAEFLQSPDRFNLFVESLAARAIKSARWFSIPRRENVRAGARWYLRRVVRRETRGIRALARLKVRRLRKHIGLMDSWFVKDNPDMTAISDMVKFSQRALYHVENALKMIDLDNADPDDVDAYSSTAQESTNTVANPDIVESTRDALVSAGTSLPTDNTISDTADRTNPQPSIRGPYLELDEEWQPPEGFRN